MTNDEQKAHFVRLFEANTGLIYKVARMFTHTTQDREDLMNDMAYALWKAFPRFKGDSKVSTWMYKVALNTAMHYARKQKGEWVHFSDLNQGEPQGTVIEWEEPSTTDLLYAYIEDLNPLEKALVLLYLDNHSHEEIASITGLSKTNVGTKLSRITEILRKKATLTTKNHGLE